MRIFALLGALFGGTAVAAGAFAAHALRDRLQPGMLELFETAARYQVYHALALLAVAWVCEQSEARAAQVAGWSFVTGIVLFSGSLYALALTGWRSTAMVAPLGGAGLLLGWAALAVAAWTLTRRDGP